MIIDIRDVVEDGLNRYPLPEDVQKGATRHVCSIQRDKDKSYMYEGFLVYNTDVWIQVPRWEHRAQLWGYKKIKSGWLHLHNPYKEDLKTAIREVKRKFAKKNNPLDIIDCKATIDILRQLHNEQRSF